MKLTSRVENVVHWTIGRTWIWGGKKSSKRNRVRWYSHERSRRNVEIFARVPAVTLLIWGIVVALKNSVKMTGKCWHSRRSGLLYRRTLYLFTILPIVLRPISRCYFSHPLGQGWRSRNAGMSFVEVEVNTSSGGFAWKTGISGVLFLWNHWRRLWIVLLYEGKRELILSYVQIEF